MKSVILNLALFALLALRGTFAAETNAAPEILTVRADGSFSNTNVIGNITAFSQAKAASMVAQGVADAAYTASTNTQKIVRDGIAEIMSGAKIEYSDIFVWSAGAVAISTNATCNVYNVKLEKGVTTNIDEVAHFAVDISYWFSEDIGSYQPGIKYTQNLDATNSWVMCVQDDPIGPFPYTTPEGVTYQNAYRTRTWMPLSLSQAFFKAFSDSVAPGTGMELDIIGGIRGGFTGDIIIPPTGSNVVISVRGGIVTAIRLEGVE